MTSINEDLINAVMTRTADSDVIVVTLADGQVAEYTKAILPLMVGDPMVARIVDKVSGEIIYMA